MAKRGLCILLAVVTLFALAAPAFAAEEAPTSGVCGDDLKWSFSDGTLTISGTGAMDDYTPGADTWEDLTPWRDLCAQVTKVVIQSGVTGIGSLAFNFCNNLASVDIPASVTSIGEDVFPSFGITDISVAEGNETYASVDGVLFNADKTTLIHYPCAKTDASYVIPKTVTTIGDGAFMYAINLTSVTIPDGVTKIGNGAFNWCLSLTDINIPSAVKTIGNFAFDTCKMTSIEIPEGVVSIGEWAFHNSGLTSVTIPASVTKIGEEAFATGNLKSVTVLNPNCVIGGESYKGEEHYSADHSLGYPADTVISGYDGSTAEAYAKWWGAAFKSLGKAPDTSKPTELTAPTVKIAQNKSGIKVTWNKVSGAPRYMVYYKENGGGWKKIGTTTATSYTRAAKNLKAGATYQFAVRCCDSDKKTLLSTYKASNKVKYVPELAAPTVKIAQTDGGIKVTWNKVSGSARYMVYYKQNGGGWKKIGTTTKTSYTRKASALKAGATYQFAVRCCASDKKTLLSTYKASNKVKYVPELAAPTVKIAQTDGGIKVTWNKVSGSAKYMVYYKQNGGSWQKIGTTAKTSYTRAASKLKAGATYQFAVRCCAGDGKTLLSGYKASNKVKFTK